MTENGEGPDRPPDGEQERPQDEGNSWFTPSGERNRTQADYQDPYEDRQGDADELTRDEVRDYQSLSSGSAYPNTGGYPGFSGYQGGVPDMAEPYPEALGDLGAPKATLYETPSAPSANDYPFDLPPRSTAGKYGTALPKTAKTDPSQSTAEERNAEDPGVGSPYDFSSGSYRPEELYTEDPAAGPVEEPGSFSDGKSASFAQGATYRLDEPTPTGNAKPSPDLDAPFAYEPKTTHLTEPGQQAVSGDQPDAPAAREPEWTPTGDAPSAEEYTSLGPDFDAPSIHAAKPLAAPGYRPGPEPQETRAYDEWSDGPDSGTSGSGYAAALGEPYTPQSGGSSSQTADHRMRPAEEESAPDQDPMSVYRIPSGGHTAGSLGADQGDRLVAPYRQSPSQGSSDWEGDGGAVAESAPGSSQDTENDSGSAVEYGVPGGAATDGDSKWPTATDSGLGGSLGTGSGDTWAFSRDDPRLPDSVREVAEREAERRAEKQADPLASSFGEASATPEWDGAKSVTADAERWSVSAEHSTDAEPVEDADPWSRRDEAPAAPVSSDPLLAIAEEQNQAREPGWSDRDRVEGRGLEGGYAETGESTQVMSAVDTDRGEYGSAGQTTYDGPGYDYGTSHYPAGSERGRVDGYDELGYPIASERSAVRGSVDELGYDDRAERGWDTGAKPVDELGYDERGEEQLAGRGFSYELGYVDHPIREGGYDQPDHAEQSGTGHDGFGDPRFEAAQEGAPLPAVGEETGPEWGDAAEPSSSAAGGAFVEDQARVRQEEAETWDDYDDDVDDRYYPEPLPEERPRSKKRDKISEEFPGFSGPLGGDPDSDADYPGYDNIEVWPETERLATATVWLGVLSLVPGVGLLFAVAALVLGPKAKRRIRSSHGELEGEQLVKGGTLLAVIGIAVSVVTVLGYLLL